MGDLKVISADTHVVEPPDIYVDRFESRLRDRAPRIRRQKTPKGREFDSWFVDDQQVATIGAFIQAGRRFEDPSQIDFLGVWEDVTPAAYDPHQTVKALEKDGIWGACFQPSQGLIWYRLPDSELLSAICKAYNDWIAEFCGPYPGRLRGIGCLNVDDVQEACRELERCSKLGLAAVFIPVYPKPEHAYRDAIYEPLWATAQDLDMPLELHIGTMRGGIPGCEYTLNLAEITEAGRATVDNWVRYSITAIIFAGVLDRYPKLKLASVEHEMSWIPHWLKLMDTAYKERQWAITWRSTEGMLPSDYWHRNMYTAFMEDDAGLRLTDIIGVDNIMWGNDFPHAESTWPQSMRFLNSVLGDFSEQDRRKMISENAATLFKFDTS